VQLPEQVLGQREVPGGEAGRQGGIAGARCTSIPSWPARSSPAIPPWRPASPPGTSR
jgi:hypothetical protein